MAYRDEQDALRIRVEILERELREAAEAGDAQRDDARAERIAELKRQIAHSEATLKQLASDVSAFRESSPSVGPDRASNGLSVRVSRVRLRLAIGARRDSKRKEARVVAMVMLMVIVPLFAFALLTKIPPKPRSVASVAIVPTAAASIDRPPPVPSAPSPPDEPSFLGPSALTLDVAIGEQGHGPGQFDDPREVAPEKDGSFYVADYASGRVQKFDRYGNYMSLIEVPPGADGPYILDMAATQDGKLFVVRAGEILSFSTTDGKKLGKVPPFSAKERYRHIFVDDANNLYALSLEGSDTKGALSKFDERGRRVGRWPRKTGSGEYHLAEDRLAVSPIGAMFVVHHFGYFVEALDGKGSVQSRIGHEGRGPGEFERLGMGSIDLDKDQHLLVANNDTISVFDMSGRFRGNLLSRHDPDHVGLVRGFRVGADARLYAATNNNKAIVYQLNAHAIASQAQ